MDTSRCGNTIADFDARAATWDDDPTKVDRARAVADAIRRQVPLAATMRALEYGAGTGLLSFLLRPDLGPITMADVSQGMLDIAARKIAATGDPTLTVVKLDLLGDPLPAARYDLVYSLMTLHHIPDTAAILERFHAVLATPGYLCIADLDTEDGSFHGEGFDGHSGFDRADLGALARRAGFGKVSFTTAYVMTKPVGSGTGRFPIFLMVAAKE
jgi:ubiquinone/menaquinone biosynthesis C-methylase UbiE